MTESHNAAPANIVQPNLAPSFGAMNGFNKLSRLQANDFTWY
jgi:hypothetical protein